MPKPNSRTVFVCQQCGNESPKWEGRCPSCHEWNSLTETTLTPPSTSRQPWLDSGPVDLEQLSDIVPHGHARTTLPQNEINRVLGGGIVPGSLVLLGGEPGIGKSTLLLQVAQAIARKSGRVIYISGEESAQQIKLRAERLGLKGEGVFFLAETNIEAIAARLEEVHPALAIVDSIQTVYLPDVPSSAGSVSQLRECTARLTRWAKSRNTPVLIAGHVTKEGAIAGPRVLEHMVDTVLYLEGEAFGPYRILRAVKNRFGSTNEVGVFEMTGQGLIDVEDPSSVFLSQRRPDAIGSAVVPVLEGTRPLLVEVQALTTPTESPVPRRVANGVDFSRLLMVAAVLSKRTGLPLGGQDIIVSVAGGMRINEPAGDLAIALAIASSFRNAPLDPATVVGEVGLSGEIRAVAQLDRRLGEASKLGFKRALVPPHSSDKSFPGIEAVSAPNLSQALRLALPKPTRSSTPPSQAES